MELLSGTSGSPGVSQGRKEAHEQRLRDDGLTHLDTCDLLCFDQVSQA